MSDYLNLLRDPMKVKPSSKRAARQKSSSTPDDVFRMNYNESPWGPSPKAVKALAAACRKSYEYPDWFAIELKKNIASLLGLDISNIAVGSGSSSLICILGEIFLNSGDEFVIGDPSYEAFRDVAYDYGAVPVIVPMAEDLSYDLDAMLRAITEKTKMIIICNPNNPTGVFTDSSKLQEFIKKIPRHVITVIDEAYMEYVTKENAYSMGTLIKNHYDRPLIVLKTFSKIYGMAGLRIGYAVSSPDLIDCMCKSSHAWNVSRIGQIAASAAISDQDYIHTIRDIIVKERMRVSSALKDMGCKVYESQTNFLLFKSPADSLKVFSELADNKILIGAPCGYNRVTIGFPEMNDKFISCMKEILSK